MTSNPVEPRPARRKLYGIVVLGFVLLAQLPVVARSQPQPYPGVVLPGFRETSNGSDLKKTHFAGHVSFADGTEQVLDLKVITSDVRESVSTPVIQRLVAEDLTHSAAVLVWLETKIAARYPGKSLTSLTLCKNSLHIDLNKLRSNRSDCALRRVYHFE